MSDLEDGSDGDDWVDCPTCGSSFPCNRVGRRLRYCSVSCRQRSYRQRQAATRIDGHTDACYELATELIIDAARSLSAGSASQLEDAAQRVSAKAHELVRALSRLAAAQRAIAMIDSQIFYQGRMRRPSEILRLREMETTSRSAFVYLVEQQVKTPAPLPRGDELSDISGRFESIALQLANDGPVGVVDVG